MLVHSSKLSSLGYTGIPSSSSIPLTIEMNEASGVFNSQADLIASTTNNGQISLPLSTEGAQQLQGLAQGRRVTIGGMNRRSSLGMTEASLGDLFARRTSGFGDGRRASGFNDGRRPSGFGEGVGRRPSGFGDLGEIFGRRDSLDSTTAVLDAAIMDLTRRRLSMAVGTMPSNDVNNANVNDPFGSLGGVNLNMNAMGMNMGNQLTSALAANQATAAAAAASSMANNPQSSVTTVTSINARQKQLQEQQRELERRQKELEAQRQQLLAAMEERRRTMQQMQQKMQLPQNGQAQRNSLGLGTLGNQQSLLMGLQNAGLQNAGLQNSGLQNAGLQNAGLQNAGLQNAGRPNANLPNAALQNSGAAAAAAAAQQGNNGQQWFVCTICNSKAFANREEAMQHESICQQGRRNSINNLRRGSLDLRRSSLDLLVSTLEQRPDAARQTLAAQAFGTQTALQQLQQETQNFGADLNMDRRFSMAGDQLGASELATTTMSNGPFAMMEKPLPLAMAPDKDWLTPLHCFVRRHCVQVFTATQKDVATPSKGKRKPIQVGQVGIRCPHCHHDESSKARERGSVYYPTTIASIYNATMNLLQRHLHNCSAVPEDIMRRYETLKADDARSGTSKKYWVESALSLGLVDTPNGIRFSALSPPPLPSLSRQQHSTGTISTARRNSNDFFSTNSNAMAGAGNAEDSKPGAVRVKRENDSGAAASAGLKDDGAADSKVAAAQGGQPMGQSAPLVTPEDEPYATAFSYRLLGQMQPCVFTEADRLGKRKGLPPGFPGLACRHCFGGYGSGRFFPSSIKTLSDTSKTLNVLHNHMMRCRKCPQEVRDTLDKLRKTHDEQRAKMKFGSQKAFFARIWDRLHFKDPSVNSKRKFQPNRGGNQQHNAVAAAAAAMAGVPNFQAGMLGTALQQGNMLDGLAMQFNADLRDNKRRKF